MSDALFVSIESINLSASLISVSLILESILLAIFEKVCFALSTLFFVASFLAYSVVAVSISLNDCSDSIRVSSIDSVCSVKSSISISTSSGILFIYNNK